MTPNATLPKGTNVTLVCERGMITSGIPVYDSGIQASGTGIQSCTADLYRDCTGDPECI